MPFHRSVAPVTLFGLIRVMERSACDPGIPSAFDRCWGSDATVLSNPIVCVSGAVMAGRRAIGRHGMAGVSMFYHAADLGLVKPLR